MARQILIFLSLSFAIIAQGLLELRLMPESGSLILILSLILFGCSFSQLHLPAPEESKQAWNQSETLTVIFLLALTAFFRFYRLDSVPPGLNHDSVMETRYAIELLAGREGLAPFYQAPRADLYGVETLFALLALPMFWLLGVTPVAIKIAGAISGMVGAFCFYLLTRYWFGPRTARIAGLLLAVCAWHFLFCRAGWRCTLVLPAEALTLLFTLRAMKSLRLADAIFCGLSCGLSLYTYSTERLLLAKIALLILVLIPVRGIPWRSAARLCAAGLSAFFAAALPMMLYAISHWDIFWARTSDLGIFSWNREVLLDNFLRTLGLFNIDSGGNDFIVGVPLLDFPVSLLFAFGFVICLVRCTDWRYLAAAIWLLLSILPGIFSSPNPNHDYAAMLPALLMAALAVRELFAAFARILLQAKFVSEIPTRAMACFSGLALITVNYFWYFHPETRRPIWGFYPEARTVGEYMSTIMDRYTVVVADNFPLDSLLFLTYRDGPFEPAFYYLQASSYLILQAQLESRGGKGVAFIAKPAWRNQGIFNELKRRYPGSSEVVLRADFDSTAPDRPVARVLLIESQDLPAS